jgi:hypothetical protein
MLRKGKNYNPEKTGKSGDFMLPQNCSGSKKKSYKHQILITNVVCLNSINLKLDICKHICNI